MLRNRIVNPCAITADDPEGFCVSHKTIEEIARKKVSADVMADTYNILDLMVDRNVTSIKELVERSDLSSARKVSEMTNFKMEGPKDTTLLDNTVIDETLKSWTKIFPRFFPHNFNMAEFEKYSFLSGETVETPDSLAIVCASDLLGNKEFTVHGRAYCGPYDCAACVINTDTYHGRGKHWMALFIDMRGRHTTIEYFNSSGNAPTKDWIPWLTRMKSEFDEHRARNGSGEHNAKGGKGTKASGKKRGGTRESAEIIKVCNIRQQHSRTECGVYSLYYIWSRLNGVAPSEFQKSGVSDEIMFEFRQHIFRDVDFDKKYAEVILEDGKFVQLLEENIKKYTKLRAYTEKYAGDIHAALKNKLTFALILITIRQFPEFDDYTKFNMNYYKKIADIKWEPGEEPDTHAKK